MEFPCPLSLESQKQQERDVEKREDTDRSLKKPQQTVWKSHPNAQGEIHLLS